MQLVSRLAIWLHVASRNMMVCPTASEQMLNWILFSKMLFIWIIYKPYVSCSLNQGKNGNVFEFFPSLWFFEVCTYGKVLMQRLHLCSCFFHGLRASIPSVLHLFGQASDRPSPFEKKTRLHQSLPCLFSFRAGITHNAVSLEHAAFWSMGDIKVV